VEQYSNVSFVGAGTPSNLAAPTDRGDATPKDYVDQLADLITDLQQQLEELRNAMADSNIALRVGPAYAADGTMIPSRASKDGAQMTRDLGGRFEEAVSRGLVFTATIGAAGVAPGVALSTTPPLILYNPPGSGRLLTLIESTLSYISGTLGAGEVVYAAPSAAQANAPSGGSALVPICNLIGGPDNLSVAVALSGATLAAAPRLLRPAYVLGAALATTANFMTVAKDYIGGAISILPGSFLCMQGISAAGSVPLVGMSFTWQETQAS
jgi:hypothetical protein